MKIFALYTDIQLVNKPGWFDEFTRRYSKAWNHHLTLTQPRYIDEDDIDALKQKVSDFFASAGLASISLAFNDVAVHKDEDGIDIFLHSAPNAALAALQKQLRDLLVGYEDFVNPQSQKYETDFKPHITIGRSLTETEYTRARGYVESGCACKALIREVVLSVVTSMTAKEAGEGANRTTYRLPRES